MWCAFFRILILYLLGLHDPDPQLFIRIWIQTLHSIGKKIRTTWFLLCDFVTSLSFNGDVNVPRTVAKSQQSWVRSQNPPTQWNLRGGRWSSVEYSTWKKNPKILLLNVPNKLREKTYLLANFLKNGPIRLWLHTVPCSTYGISLVNLKMCQFIS